MKSYISAKLIKAIPAFRYGSEIYENSGSYPSSVDVKDIQEGYKIVYSDNYTSWCPKDIFERSYLKVDDNKNLPSRVSIGAQMVDDFILDYDVFTKQDKITIVIATLRNGFTIVESSACVDPKNYSEEIGAEICKERIKNQVWNHLGFLLQTAFKGIN